MTRTISLKEAERVIEINRRQKENEHLNKINKWIESKIGSTWVYRNNTYGSGSYWDVFMIVIDRVDNRTALVETWELIDPKKRTVEIQRELRYLYNESDFTGYIECDKDEFMKNKLKILKQLRLTQVTEGSS